MQEVNSLSDLFTLLESAVPDGSICVFRGQSDSRWNLTPGFYRYVEKLDPPLDVDNDYYWISQVERDLYRLFHDRGMRLVPEGTHHTHTKWFSLFLGQHYGLPTRLLDWSMDRLAAAYFACSSNYGLDGKLYILNVTDIPHPKDLGRLSGGAGFRLEAVSTSVRAVDLSFFDPQSQTIIGRSRSSVALPSNQFDGLDLEGILTVIDPPSVDERIARQSGVFTIYLSTSGHEIVSDHTQLIEHLENISGNKLLTTVRIPADSKEKIVEELKRSGKDPFSIFPDIQGLVQLAMENYYKELLYWQDERKNWQSA